MLSSAEQADIFRRLGKMARSNCRPDSTPPTLGVSQLLDTTSFDEPEDFLSMTPDELQHFQQGGPL
jgi:hypothetical protein